MDATARVYRRAWRRATVAMISLIAGETSIYANAE
jgi:hypothetical protein